MHPVVEHKANSHLYLFSRRNISKLLFSLSDLFKQCILSEIAATNEVIFRFKTSETTSVFSLVINERPFLTTFVVADAFKGTIKLVRSLLDSSLTWRSDNTVRATGILTQTKGGLILNRISIEFIILKEGYADALLSNVISSVATLAKPNNPFRATSARYPIYKKLHRILMQGTKRAKETSLAECKFESAFKALVKLILNQLQGNNYCHLSSISQFPEQQRRKNKEKKIEHTMTYNHCFLTIFYALHQVHVLYH